MTTTTLPLQLLRVWDGGTDVVGWHASEKVCGLRIQWDGQRFLTRSGAVLDVPASYHADMGPDALDGEMATPDGDLRRLLSLQKLGRRGDWSGVYFWPFDLPLIGVHVEDRLRRLATMDLPQQCRRVPHVRIRDEDHLHGEFLGGLLDRGAEGAVFRQPQSHYHNCRHSSWLKFRF